MDNAGHRWESTSALYFCAITTAVALALSPLPSRADLPEFATYQIPMGNPAANAQEALSTLPNRIREVINWNACADEIHFLEEEEKESGEGNILAHVLAKVAWISERGLNQHCIATVEYFIVDRNGDGVPDDPWEFGRLNKDKLNKHFRERFPGPSMGEINAPDALHGVSLSQRNLPRVLQHTHPLLIAVGEDIDILEFYQLSSEKQSDSAMLVGV